MKRSTFRRRKNYPNNDNMFAYRGIYANQDHYARLHDPKRRRTPRELDTIRRAAQRRPHGWAAAFIAATETPAKSARKSRAKAAA